MSEAAISVRDVWKFFGEFPAIRGLSLEVPASGVLALLGRNGAGKTTLLRIMAGLLRPSKGSIEIPGSQDRLEQARSIGMVGHGQWLYEDLTAKENLEFFAALYEVAGAKEQIAHWLEETGLWKFRDSRVGEFSRGMRQRLTVARAFLHDPKILLLDEPWTALDDRAMNLVSSLLLGARSRNRTVVVCSHQLHETLSVATHIAVLERGRLIFRGENTDEFKSSPRDFYQRIS